MHWCPCPFENEAYRPAHYDVNLVLMTIFRTVPTTPFVNLLNFLEQVHWKIHNVNIVPFRNHGYGLG